MQSAGWQIFGGCRLKKTHGPLGCKAALLGVLDPKDQRDQRDHATLQPEAIATAMATGPTLSDRMSINSQIEHLQAKYVGTGHADLTRFEWALNIHRDSYASYVGHHNMLAYFATVENEVGGVEGCREGPHACVGCTRMPCMGGAHPCASGTLQWSTYKGCKSCVKLWSYPHGVRIGSRRTGQGGARRACACMVQADVRAGHSPANPLHMPCLPALLCCYLISPSGGSSMSSCKRCCFLAASRPSARMRSRRRRTRRRRTRTRAEPGPSPHPRQCLVGGTRLEVVANLWAALPHPSLCQ